jgi:hypothetical protein
LYDKCGQQQQRRRDQQQAAFSRAASVTNKQSKLHGICQQCHLHPVCHPPCLQTQHSAAQHCRPSPELCVFVLQPGNLHVVLLTHALVGTHLLLNLFEGRGNNNSSCQVGWEGGCCLLLLRCCSLPP